MFKESGNKVETIIKTSEEPQSSRLTGTQRLKECSLILGVLFSILLAVALLTFNPADPSWSQTAWGGDIQNAGGYVGAWLADTLFFIFGSLAYPLPILVTLAAWVLFRKRDEDETIDFMLWGTRLLGLTILLLTSCGLADINFDDIWYFSSGGVIGDVMTSLALPTLNILGSTLVLLFLWGAGFTLLTGISWLSIVEWLGNTAIHLFTALVNKMRGHDQEVMEPELKETEQHDELQAAPSNPPKESMAEEVQELNDPLTSDPSLHFSATNEPEVEMPVTEPKRHFNIHMPEKEPEVAVKPSAVKPVEKPQPVYHAPEEPLEEGVERSKQLNATIEQLEHAAMDEDDLAEQVQTEDHHSQAAYQEYMQEQPVEPQVAPEPVVEQEPEHSVDPAQNLESVEQVSFTSNPEPEVVPEPMFIEQPAVENEIVEETAFEETPRQESSIDESHWNETDTEVEKVEEQAIDLPWEEVTEEEPAHPDQDVAAFQNIVSEAQANMAAAQNPFLVQKEPNLPKPTSPMPTLELLYHPEKRDNFIGSRCSRRYRSSG